MSVDTKTVVALKAIFEGQKISTVAIVDDAYYASPSRASFKVDELATLFEQIGRWQNPIDEFRQLGLDLDSPDDLTDVVIGAIYQLAGKSEDIKVWFTDYDNQQEQRRHQLRELEDFLKRDMALTVQRLTPTDNLDADNLPQLVFLDYYLDPSDEVENSLALAKAIGAKIELAYPDNKPLVILMSSRDSLTAIQKNQFRENAKLIAGLFHFVPKSELKKNAVLVLKLAVMVRSVSDGKRVQHFVDSFDSALAKASDQLRLQVRGLSLEDYAYIQQLSLQREGMPLGDYLLWLFGTYFGQLLFSAIPKERAELDAMTFSFIPESDTPPTKEFVDLYRQVVAGVVDDLGVHPRADDRARQNQQWSPPDPHFGDVFVDDARNEALMIITPECDLTFTPEQDELRPAQAENSILMLPGKLVETAMFEHDAEPYTSLFPLEDKTYRINWDVKAIYACRFSELRAKMSDRRLKRRARIRHPFSTYAQATALNDVARIAIPVAPPHLRKGDVEIHCRVASGEEPQVSRRPASAILSRDRSGRDLVMLKLDATAAIVDAANMIAPILAEAAANAEPDSNEQRRLGSLEGRINAFLSDLDRITALKRTFPLSLTGSYAFPNSPIEVVRDRTKLNGRLKSVPIVVLVEEEKS